MTEDVIFLSHKLDASTPQYGGASDIQIQSNTAISAGDTANTLSLSLPNHAGTHVDVPYHFFNDGKKLTDYDASFWVFNAPQLIHVPGEDGYLVSYDDVSGRINMGTDLLLIRTGYEKLRLEQKYWQKSPGLSANLATGLRSNHPNIRAIGVDIISITSRFHREEGRRAHIEFLGTQYETDPIVVIEDMSLKNYTNDISQVMVAPLMISNADGASCTVFARGNC